jgi:hypothetical protein
VDAGRFSDNEAKKLAIKAIARMSGDDFNSLKNRVTEYVGNEPVPSHLYTSHTEQISSACKVETSKGNLYFLIYENEGLRGVGRKFLSTQRFENKNFSYMAGISLERMKEQEPFLKDLLPEKEDRPFNPDLKINNKSGRKL